MDTFDLTKYIDIALRRKYWIIIVVLFSVLAGLTYTLVVPKIYEAETLILVQPQNIPQNFVTSIVSSDINFRLTTIIRQVTSRTNLERIIETHQLYSEPGNTMLMDDKVGLLREMIRFDIEDEDRDRRDSGPESFTIAFRGGDPKNVASVTNALASNFITENLKIRESQTIGTSSFLSDELDSVKRRLVDKEVEIKGYKGKYMGGLPEQLQTNLSILERLQARLDKYNGDIREAENRKILFQNRIAEAKKNLSTLSSLPGQDNEVKDLNSLRNQLALLEVRYTDNHPDVIRLKKTISRIEEEQSESSASGTSNNRTSELSGINQPLKQQLQDIELTITSLNADIKETKPQINFYQKKVEETPKREQELLSLMRDYENLKGLYSSLLNRTLEAEIAVSMERKQKGEQFRIIDPAKTPIRPVKPDIRVISLLTIMLGLGMGVGLAFMREAMDTSYKNPDEVEHELNLPVLVSMPFSYTKKELKNKIMKNFLKASAVSVGFALSAVTIVFLTKGVDNTIYFFKNIFENIS